ncbi:hypothetical protein HBI38_007240 [Parastagonospora nodorum]|nr:hypothetical protein HBI73_006590 [Parastagonospora nodorum]KAH6332578.1 hypothetical protein HBI38_007240 [Parastagonospora nodorum]
MLSLSRRKPPQRQLGALNSLTELPDDILILVAAQCRIDELFSLRLTCARTRDLIDEYITTIAPSVARCTFPLSDLLLSKYVDTVTPFTFRSLKALIPEHLASVLVDRHRLADKGLQSRYGIPAEDPFGNEIRTRVASGWRILRDISNISRQEYGTLGKGTRMSPGDFATKMFRPAHFKLEALKHVEDTVLQKRLEYFTRLEHKYAQDYKLMFTLLSSAFSTSISNVGDEHLPWVFDSSNGFNGQRELRKGKTWLSWYLLAEGPDLFWQQWHSLPHDLPTTRNYIRDNAIEAFKNTPQKLSDHQRILASTLQEAVDEHALLKSEFEKSDPIRYFANYAEHRLVRADAGLPPAREILHHIPFFINFRCPEEVVQRHEALGEEREISRAMQTWPR